MTHVNIYTDGSCYPNPGPGGWAAILIFEDRYRKMYGGVPGPTTNNRMEIQAVLEAILRIKKPCTVKIHTDSKNVIGWLHGWDTITNLPDRSKQWRCKKIEIANLCEMVAFEVETRQISLDFELLKGHTGHPLNEECDRLAALGRKQAAALGVRILVPMVL